MSHPPRSFRAGLLDSPDDPPDVDGDASARAFKYIPKAAIRDPREIPHAPTARRLVSEC